VKLEGEMKLKKIPKQEYTLEIREVAVKLVKAGEQWSRSARTGAPKHGSWLNMAEMEFSVLSRTCLADEFPMKQLCDDASTPTLPSATPSTSPSTGVSQFVMRAPSFTASIHQRQHD
jgi:hypothetical protein